VDGVESTPNWFQLDESVYPPEFVVFSNNPPDAGIYAVTITSYLNTAPTSIPTGVIEVTVTLSLEPCSTILFDDPGLLDMTFTIADGAVPTTSVFADFTDSGGQFNCGPRDYYIFTSHPSLSLDPVSRTLSVETTDWNEVGTHEVSILVWLRDYPTYNHVVELIASFNIIIDASCHYTTIDYTAPLADLIHALTHPPATY